MDYKKEAIKLLKKYNFDMDSLEDCHIDAVARCIEREGISHTEALILLGIKTA